ncbi:MAG: hypothetical protein Q7R97_05230 [Candidatus Daviesbacteria bacterium]|nr:hypothetical protein [Candidatus Daviesbacteria bacterium]
MEQVHICEILEALRGKTIVDRIRLGYRLSLSKSAINELQQGLDVIIVQDSNYLDLTFQPNFLTYVQWPYFSAVEETQQVIGKAKTSDIYAHQLFEDKNNSFALRFNESGLIFENRRNIEGTLFLDLQRYCEHNRIHYEVR